MDRLSLATAGFLVLFVLAAYLSVAFRSLRTMRSIDDFFIFNRRLRDTSVFSTTFAAEMSLATVFIAFMTLAPVLGINLFVAMFTFTLGQLVLFIVIPHIKKRVYWGETLQTFLGEAYGSLVLRYIASIASLLGFVGLFSIEIIVGTTLFTSLSGSTMNQASIVAFVAAIVVFYTTLGGFKSVVATDRWQAIGVLFVVGVLVFCAFSVGEAGRAPLIPEGLRSIPIIPLLLVNFLIINTLYPLCDMSAWQRIAAARDVTTARRGFLAAILSFLLTWGLLIFAALALTDLTQGASEGGAIIRPLAELAKSGLAGTIIVGLALAALAAAMLSTGDTFLIAAAQSLSIDLLDRPYFEAKRRAEREAEEQDGMPASLADDEPIPRGIKEETYAGTTSIKVLYKARMSIVIMASVGIIVFAYLRSIGFQVADFVFVVYGSTVALFPSIVGAFRISSVNFRKRLSPWAIASLGGGLISGWIYGVAAVEHVAPTLYVLGPGSAYNSPTVALIVSLLIYMGGLGVVSAKKL